MKSAQSEPTLEGESRLVTVGSDFTLHRDEETTALSEARRNALKAKLKAGELDELHFRAVVFRDGPNANHTRFRASDLADFAASFGGQPFLRNHDTRDIGARDGTVVESSLVGNEIHQTIRLTTERGMRDFLEGIIDRFSIGWYFAGVECAICHADWFECSHSPGQRVGDQLCELIFNKPLGKETSAVNAPAVQGTRLLTQLSLLKESASFIPAIGSGLLSPPAIGSGLLSPPAIGSGLLSPPAIGAGAIHLPPAIGARAIDKERAMRVEENAILLPDGSKKVVPAKLEQQQSGQLPLSGITGDLAGEVRALRAQIDAERVEQMITTSNLSEEGKSVVRLATKGQGIDFTAQLIDAQRKVEGTRMDGALVKGIRPVVTEGMMTTPMDRFQSAWNWVLGVREEPMPVPSMRSLRDLYLSLTGDFDWHGRFNPEWSQLATATTTTLAGITVNALNKVIKMHYDNMATYRWYENIVDVAPHDGSTHNVQLLMVDGIANLPVVNEGAAYTEASVGDSRESMAFTKRGHYVGITLEAIRRSDIQRIQAIPRALVQGAIRSRSAAIAAIFTVNTATGPTLSDDSTALFHANHGNTATTALSDAAWGAARTRIWEQNIPGTSKPLGLWPKFVLVPIELYDPALTLFGYGSGDVGKPGASFGQQVNPYGESRLGDPRPVPIVVPDWTDATNWAYIVDPRLHPVIHMAYANAPQGGMHALPEIFEVTDERSGLIFSNDTLSVN